MKFKGIGNDILQGINRKNIVKSDTDEYNYMKKLPPKPQT